MSEQHGMVCGLLAYIELFLILGSKITGCISISDFASLVAIPIGITSSATGLNIWAMIAVS